jgi:hypothetical protein
MLQICMFVTQDLGARDIVTHLCDLQQLNRGNSVGLNYEGGNGLWIHVIFVH